MKWKIKRYGKYAKCLVIDRLFLDETYQKKQQEWEPRRKVVAIEFLLFKFTEHITYCNLQNNSLGTVSKLQYIAYKLITLKWY